MSISRRLDELIPFAVYTLATCVLVAPAFTVSQFDLPQWLSFLIVSMPFGGRVLGSLIYQRVIASLGPRLTFAVSLSALGLLSAGGSLNDEAALLLLRLLLGIAFGIATSLAVEQAVRSGSRLIVALTMSGWAFGWIASALSYLTLRNWQAIAVSGLMTLPFSLLYNRVEEFQTANERVTLPPVQSVLIFLLSFEPAFALQLAPSIIEGQCGIIWLIIGYVASVPVYLLIPAFSSLFGEARTEIAFVTASAISGVTFFLTSSPYALIPFTAFGLGVNALAPRIALAYGVSARNMGLAINTAALGGMAVPVISSFDVRPIASLLTALSMAVLLVMSLRKSNATAVGV